MTYVQKYTVLNKYWDVLRVCEQVGVGHVTVLDQWGGAVWDNRLSLAGWAAGQWWRRKGTEEDEVVVSVRVRNKKCDMCVLTLIKLQIREEVPCRLWSEVLARGGFVSVDNTHRK